MQMRLQTNGESDINGEREADVSSTCSLIDKSEIRAEIASGADGPLNVHILYREVSSSKALDLCNSL
jgi:hypothetical protein